MRRIWSIAFICNCFLLTSHDACHWYAHILPVIEVVLIILEDVAAGLGIGMLYGLGLLKYLIKGHFTVWLRALAMRL